MAKNNCGISSNSGVLPLGYAQTIPLLSYSEESYHIHLCTVILSASHSSNLIRLLHPLQPYIHQSNLTECIFPSPTMSSQHEYISTYFFLSILNLCYDFHSVFTSNYSILFIYIFGLHIPKHNPFPAQKSTTLVPSSFSPTTPKLPYPQLIDLCLPSYANYTHHNCVFTK